MSQINRPAVLLGAATAAALGRGFAQMGRLLALTLGPAQGGVLNQRELGGVEWLGSAGDVARRVVALPDAAADVGAMLMRNLAWRAHERAGDGAATTAVLAWAIYREAQWAISAGASPMLLRRGIDQAVLVALAQLQSQAWPASDEESLTAVAETLTGEARLSLLLGEMFALLGAEAQIEVEEYVAPYLDRAYHDGGRWVARLESPLLVTDHAGQRAVLADCQVALVAGVLRSAEDILPLLRMFDTLEPRRLLLVAHEVAGEALNALVVNHRSAALPAMAVALRRRADLRATDLADLALLTGATVLDAAVGRSVGNLAVADLGRLRRAEANAAYLLVSGGAGPAEPRRVELAALRTRLVVTTDQEQQSELRLRLARLAGGVGVLQVGAYSAVERTQLQRQAERAIRALRLAMAEGVVPGGGAAYLHAAQAVQQLTSTLVGEEAQGAAIVARALEAPLRQIVQNRKLATPAVVAERVRAAGTGHGYDALEDCVTAPGVGPLDPVGVLRVALETAASGAVLALTTGALVLRRSPERSLEP